jgi:arylsulfatase A-like enzyme/Tfp pilus assembly protein PilF
MESKKLKSRGGRARGIQSRGRTLPRVVTGIAIAALATGAIIWQLRSRSRVVRKSELNLLLITLDTTRADSLGAYGAKDAETPNFDRIAKEGVVFDETVTAAPLTLPAHSSLFTAKYPPQHGVRDNGGFFLDPRETTLAERLKARGFRTGGFVGAYVLDRRWGIAQGFDTYFDNFDLEKAKGPVLATVERPANEVADRALAWLGAAASSRFFAWVHFYDAHSPYDPPEPYRTRFSNRPYSGEVAFVDSRVGRLMTFLEQRHLLEKTIVVIVGDHGESLGEHGESTHGFFVYQSVLHVPFAILAPFDPMHGRRVGGTVRSIDLAPTVLELLGVPFEGSVDGRSLVPLMTGAAHELPLDAYSEAMYPRYHFGWSALRSLTAGRFKYISAPRPELYDIQQDPGEVHNLFEARRALADRMAESLHALENGASDAPRRATDVEPDVRARLAALGYVGTFVSTPSRRESALADPKDKIELFNLMTDARQKLQDEREASDGIEMLKRVAAADPQVIDAWLLLGNEYAKQGKYVQALTEYRRALELKPDYDLALRNMAGVYRDMGRPGDAVAGFERLLSVDPNNLQVRQELAQLLLDGGRVADAEGELKTVLEQDPGMAAAHNTLGALRLKQGSLDVGEREIRVALAQRPDLPLAHFNLAVAAEQRSDVTGAIAEYRQEIERHAGSYMAQFNLGKLYERLGDREGQLKAYEDAIASNPRFAEGNLFLAKLYLDRHDFTRAESLARRGLEIAPDGEWAPLGHFVLSDADAALGRREEAAREAAEGRRLASRKH